MKSIQPHSRRRQGFTLVELLTVIVIIGILMGIAIPAILGAIRTSRETGIRTEIGVLAQAMESYKLEHGDYPPDFTDWAVAERHFRQAFPEIDNNELRILAQFTHYNNMMNRTNASGPADPRTSGAYAHYPHAIDRAEALVFCLGGYSKDKKRPFTGQGGPLVLVSGAAGIGEPSGNGDDYLFYQYNTDRESGQFTFETDKLAIKIFEPDPNPDPLATVLAAVNLNPAYTYSTDEDWDETDMMGPFNTNILGLHYYADPFPTYNPPGVDRPLVYFNNRNYDMAWGSTQARAWKTAARAHHDLNMYLPSGDAGSIADSGVARPYASDTIDTTPPRTMEGIAVAGTVRRFAEADKFQIVSSGLDNNYGGVVGPAIGPSAAGICVFPTGEYYNPLTAATSSVNKFQDDDYLLSGGNNEMYRSQPQLDNITNFTTRTLESDLP